jgi:Uma2 family endonuclease
MADNTLQFEWIVTIKGGLEAIFRDRLDVFVAGDLLWYPVEGRPDIRIAPEVLVAIGRPKGYRGSYRQWDEGDVVPQVVFEVLSPGNRFGEMQRKLRFYDQYGVQEYYVFDPDSIELFGWRRIGNALREIPAMNGWTSPVLNVRFDLSSGDLKLFGPDNRPFATYLELVEKTETESQRANVAEQRADVAEQRAARLAAKLRELGIEPD